MTLNIYYMYPELLNMHGDIGNIKIIESRAKQRGIEVYKKNFSVGDIFDPLEADIVMLCGGQDFEMQIASDDIKCRNIELIKEYIENEGVFLAICGGYQMLGEFYISDDGHKIEGLKILPHYTESGEKRFVGDIIINVNGYRTIGFENHIGKTYIGDMQPLGEVLHGFGNNNTDTTEGIRYKNTYCTYLHGPLLSKNPKLADEIIKNALDRKYSSVNLTPLDDEYEESARRVILKRYEIV